jgi:primosomal protein N' (replication factor Y) (superfamily II helicase)
LQQAYYAEIVDILLNASTAMYPWCHHCSKREKPPTLCPECESYRIKFIGSGTQKVVNELEKFCHSLNIKQATTSIVRLDINAVSNQDQRDKILSDFKKGRYKILVSTSYGIKSELLPTVRLVSIITIDPLLSLPDFRMGEEVCHIRDKLKSLCSEKFLFQTYVTNNDFFKDNFLEEEFENRKILLFPPFAQIITLSYSDYSPGKAEQEAKLLKNKLQTQWNYLQLASKHNTLDLRILGPAPAFIPRVNSRYIWQIMLKSKIKDLKLRNKLLHIVTNGWKIDVDPIHTT